MSAPALPPQFLTPPPFAPSSDCITIWPDTQTDNEQEMIDSHADYPPFKKPRNFEDTPSNSVPNTLRMPTPNPPTPRGIGKIFFKTRICAKFKAGTCPYGSNCNFAHGIDDMRMPPPNWQEIVATHGDDRIGNWEEDQKIISRMKLCKKFCSGEECPYGERCNFLHEDPAKFRDDPGRYRESSVISVGTTGSPFDNGSVSDQTDMVGSSVDSIRVNPKPLFWKTRICNKWETTGNCPFGEKCHFAHGLTELQKFGGQNEAETANANTAQSRPLPNSSSDIGPSETAKPASSKQQSLSKKFLSQWKGPEKISHIYADWIDDLPLFCSSPSKVDNSA